MADWPSDKELEDIYRKGSERHDIQYSEEAWDDLEKLLDDKKRKKRFFFLIFAIGFVSLGYLTLPLFMSTPESETISNQTANKNIEDKSLAPTLTQEGSAKHTDNLTSQEIAASAAKHSNTIESNSKTDQIDIPKTPIESAQRNPISVQESLTESNGLVSKQTKTKSSEFTADQNHLTQKPAIYSSTTMNTTSGEKSRTTIVVEAQQNAGVPLVDLLNPIDLLTIQKLEYRRSDIANIPVFDLPLATETPNKKNRFTHIAQIGIESSWTPKGEYSRIDYNLGLRSRYAISKRLTLNVGAYYLQDSYIAEKGDYKPGNNFWKTSETPEYTEANCNMIEIATGLSYALKKTDNAQLSVGIDLLSNFMLKEKYSYHFTTEANNFESSWTTANRTFLNGISISSNYRLNVSKNRFIEAGPYLKIPLGGIGHGSIMLSAVGLRVGVGL